MGAEYGSSGLVSVNCESDLEIKSTNQMTRRPKAWPSPTSNHWLWHRFHNDWKVDHHIRGFILTQMSHLTWNIIILEAGQHEILIPPFLFFAHPIMAFAFVCSSSMPAYTSSGRNMVSPSKPSVSNNLNIPSNYYLNFTVEKRAFAAI